MAGQGDAWQGMTGRGTARPGETRQGWIRGNDESVAKAQTRRLPLAYVHSDAEVEDTSSLSEGCYVWRYSHVREGAQLGKNVVIGNGCFIDENTIIGDGARIQNGVSIYKGARIGKMVFVGPSVVFTNCRRPMVREEDDPPFEPDETIIEDYAVIGANATLVAPLKIGEGAMVAAGSTIAKDVMPYWLVSDAPKIRHRPICRCKAELNFDFAVGVSVWNEMACPQCGRVFRRVGRAEGIWKDQITLVCCGKREGKANEGLLAAESPEWGWGSPC